MASVAGADPPDVSTPAVLGVAVVVVVGVIPVGETSSHRFSDGENTCGGTGGVTSDDEVPFSFSSMMVVSGYVRRCSTEVALRPPAEEPSERVECDELVPPPLPIEPAIRA